MELREDAGEGSEGEGTACNFVGELQEMTQQRLCAPPVYEFKSRPEQEDGKRAAAAAAAAGGAEFVCTVRLLGLKAAGGWAGGWGRAGGGRGRGGGSLN